MEFFSVKYQYGGSPSGSYYILYDNHGDLYAEYHPQTQKKPMYVHPVPDDIKSVFEKTPHLLTKGAQRYSR